MELREEKGPAPWPDITIGLRSKWPRLKTEKPRRNKAGFCTGNLV